MPRYLRITLALRNSATTLVLFIGIALTSSAQAQLANGNYTYSNDQYTLKFTIVDNGWSITNTTLTSKTSSQIETQKGGQFMKGPAGYQGPRWYQFQTVLCNYSFDEPQSSLNLSRHDCTDKNIQTKGTIDLKKN